MPTNLHPLIRYQTIDRCLRQKGKKWNAKSLSQACGDALREKNGSEKNNPSIRTIKNDLAIMRSSKLGYEAPIVWDAKRQSYYYEQEDYSITNIPLSNEDLTQLSESLHFISQFKSFKNIEGMEQAVRKLEMIIRKDTFSHPPIILFETNTLTVGKHWIDRLYDFILNKECIQIQYHPFDVAEAYKRVVSPYLIKEYNNRWFLIGYDHTEQKIRTYALDRMLDLEIFLLETYYLTPSFDTAHYFKNIIGVSIPDGATPETIEIKATPEQAKYIRTKPLHSSQKESTSSPGVFTYQLIMNYELESLLLSFGEKVKVLNPKTLRDKLRQRITELYEQYD
jgi:predicted DNA-binding transcriptional regulator YafY